MLAAKIVTHLVGDGVIITDIAIRSSFPHNHRPGAADTNDVGHKLRAPCHPDREATVAASPGDVENRLVGAMENTFVVDELANSIGSNLTCSVVGNQIQIVGNFRRGSVIRNLIRGHITPAKIGNRAVGESEICRIDAGHQSVGDSSGIAIVIGERRGIVEKQNVDVGIDGVRLRLNRYCVHRDFSGCRRGNISHRQRVVSATTVVGRLGHGQCLTRDVYFEAIGRRYIQYRVPVFFRRDSDEESALQRIATSPDRAAVFLTYRHHLEFYRCVGIRSDGDFFWYKLAPVIHGQRESRKSLGDVGRRRSSSGMKRFGYRWRRGFEGLGSLGLLRCSRPRCGRRS